MLVTVNRIENKCKINVPSFYDKDVEVYTLKKSNTKMLDSYGRIAIKKE